jgi:hypothetical protein
VPGGRGHRDGARSREGEGVGGRAGGVGPWTSVFQGGGCGQERGKREREERKGEESIMNEASCAT